MPNDPSGWRIMPALFPLGGIMLNRNSRGRWCRDYAEHQADGPSTSTCSAQGAPELIRTIQNPRISLRRLIAHVSSKSTDRVLTISRRFPFRIRSRLPLTDWLPLEWISVHSSGSDPNNSYLYMRKFVLSNNSCNIKWYEFLISAKETNWVDK